MKPSDDLFQLIKSLTKAEKRRFKLSASLQKGEKQYLRLFDAIDAQAVYDEQTLREQFTGARFLRQFSVAKKYLYDLILKTLRVVYADEAAAAQARNLLHSASILYNKGLTGQAMRLLDKVIRIATEHELHSVLTDALYKQGYFDTQVLQTEELLDQNFSRIFASLDARREALVYEQALFRLRLALRNDVPTTTQDREEADRWLAVLTPAADAPPASLDAWKWIHLGHYLHAVGRGDFYTAFDHITKLVERFERNPVYLRENLSNYLLALHNVAATNRMLYDVEGLESTIAKMKALADVSTAAVTSPFRENLFTAVYLHRIKHLNEMGEFELAGTLEKEIEEGLRRYGEHMAPETRMSFYTALAHMHFGRENYHRALDYNNRILADSEPEIRPIRYYHARLFNLMIHYELGNYSLLEHLIRSTYRYLTIRGATSRFEEIVIAFFRRLLRMRSRRELRRIAEETLTELMLLWYDPLPARGIDYSGFGLWLRRYIEGRTLVELAKEEYAQKQERVRQMAPQI